MDFSKIQGHPDIIVSAGLGPSSPNNLQFSPNNNAQMIENQKRHRLLFSEFLYLISEILLMNQTPDTLKLINEVLVHDEQWQESIKTFTISLFLQDIVGSINIQEQSEYLYQIIEGLRGINILNFEEPNFMLQLMSCGDLNIYKQAKDSIHSSTLCSLNIMKYFSAVTSFFQHVISLYFSSYQTHYKSKGQANTNANTSNVKEAKQYNSKAEYTSKDKKYVDPQATPDQKQQKYWKQVIRKILYHFMFLITPPNGLLSQYLQNNAINYVNLAPDNEVESYLVSPIIRQKQSLDLNAPCPINFQLTLTVLNFVKVIFEIPDRFTKYVFIEELMLFYIRTHYISFVRLYNKNFQKNINSNKESSLTLCKKHLECLFAISKNRNEDTRRKLYQFKIVQFLCQEIQLEFEVQQRRQKFLQVSKEEKEKITLAQDEQKIQQQSVKKIQMPPLKIGGLGLTGIKLDKEENKGESFQNSQDQNNYQTQQAISQNKILKDQSDSQEFSQQKQEPKKFSMPPLKIGGLGLTGITNDDLKKDEQVQNEQTKIQSETKSFIPPLKIGGLGMSTLIKDKVQDTKILEQSTDTQIQQQKQQSKVPMLNIGGLGMSTLVKDKFQETKNEEQKQENIEPLPGLQKPSLKIPMLKIGGLGMSTLIKDSTGDVKEGVKEENINNLSQQQKQQPNIPMLKIGGLGMSTLIKSNNEKQEENFNQTKQELNNSPKFLNNEEAQKEEEYPQKQAPLKFKIPPLQTAGLGFSTIKKSEEDNTTQINEDQAHSKIIQNSTKQLPFKAPILNLDGIGHSTLIKDAEEQIPYQHDQITSNQQIQKPPLKMNMPLLNIKGLSLSTLQKEPTQREEQNLNRQIQQEQSQDKQSSQFQEEEKKELIQQFPKVTPKINIPPIKIKGLSLTGLIMDTDVESKTIDPSSTKEQLFNKKTNNFDKTAPQIKNLKDEALQSEASYIQNNGAQQNLNNILKAQDNQNSSQQQNIQDNQGFVQGAEKMPNNNKVIFIPQDQIDQTKKQKFNDLRKNLIPRKKNMLSSVSNYSQVSVDDGQLSEQQKQGNKNMIISNNSVISQMKIESVIEANSNNISPKSRSRSTIQNIKSNYQSNFSQTPNQNSGRSNGSFIGQNKVYVPYLKFPNDMNDDPTEKVIIYQRPDEARFKLAKTKDSVGKTPDKDLSQISIASSMNKPKLMGKRGKLLNLQGVSGESHEIQEVNKSESCVKQVVMIGQQEKHFSFKDDIIKSQLNRMLTAHKEEEKASGAPPNIQEQNEQMQQLQEKQKKPIVPTLNFPLKMEKLEGKEKIKQQIETQDNFNNHASEVGNLTKLEQSLTQNNNKFQLLLDKQINEKDSLRKLGGKNLNIVRDEPLNHEILMSEAMFYLKERTVRPIYQDEDLHVLMLSLMICLLLKPERGTLDDLYCSQFPIDNGKQNILFLLHHHINHQENQHIVPKLLKKEATISPPLAGQRLLKLLCTQLFDISMYNNGRDWKKLAEGAYAKVYESRTNLSEPQAVAIKQMQLPNSIYDRCVLHDIFTEITCLEEFRLEPCVTDLFDYGVDKSCYYIVQKKYACSLREWRLKQKKESLIENLSLYLSIYKEILKALSTIHSHNVTHYDLKCDNILIDLGSNNNANQLNRFGTSDDEKIRITIGDFGECKIFSNDKDELCNRNRGTDYIKSPEMLELTINTRKDTDKYDRRKQVGTNRLSDVWSIGCLFYELLTGEYLFQEQDYIQSFLRITRASEQLFTNDKLAQINNNVYLIDFLKYSLVRDQRMRPSIENVSKRFEHVHALLVSTSSANTRFNIASPNNYSIRGTNSFENLIDQASKLMMQNSTVFGGEIKEEIGQGVDADPHILQQNTDNQKDNEDQNGIVQQHLPLMMRIMEDVFLSSNLWLKHKIKKAIKMGITHIIIEENYVTQSLKDKFDVMEIPEYSDFMNHTSAAIKINPFLLMPTAMDFLRRAALQHGRVLFVENHYELIENKQTNRGVKCQLIRECLLICLNAIYQTNAYETYTLIKSQNLFFKISSDRLATISKWSLLTSKITQYMMTFPRFTCLCGSCVIIVKRQFANYSNMQTISCTCNQYYKNLETSQCPSPGCMEFTHYMKAFFKINYDSLHWGFLEDDDFILGPNYTGQYQNLQYRQLQSNISQTLDKNCDIVSIVEKKSSNATAYTKDVIQDYNMISKSSATAKNYHHSSYARWKLFKCSECHVWTHAYNENGGSYAVLLNNRVKEAKSSIGLLNQRQNGNIDGVRVPILQKIKLKIPF